MEKQIGGRRKCVWASDGGEVIVFRRSDLSGFGIICDAPIRDGASRLDSWRQISRVAAWPQDRPILREIGVIP